MLSELQPQAIIFSDGGPGCRWVGNEKGFAGATALPSDNTGTGQEANAGRTASPCPSAQGVL